MAKKPAMTATRAATPPFATKELAGDDVVGDEAAELAAEEPVGPELVIAPPLEALAGADTEARDDAEALEAPDAMDDALPLPEDGIGVYRIELGVALGPVGERLAVEKEIIKKTSFKQQWAKNGYQQRILAVVTGRQLRDRPGSLIEYKKRRPLGIENWCTRTPSRC